MTFREKYGPTALVAGASEGMGAAYAHALGARGLDLVLIGRRRQPLEETTRRITEQFGVKVLPVICDLSAADAVQQINNAIGDLPIDFLVYNAASSYIGPYLATGLPTHKGIAAVNMLTPLDMLHYFGGKMVGRHRGGIVIMTSIAGFQGSGYLATYAATKAFSRVLAEGLWYEWRPLGVDVIACCAGATATPNYLRTNPGKASVLEPKPQLPEQVAEECLNRIGTTPSFVSGGGNKLVSFLMRHLFTGKKSIEIMGDGMKKMYRIKDPANYC
jgi:short-subunit dehydrogenase